MYDHRYDKTACASAGARVVTAAAQACPRGHDLTGDNVATSAAGRRACVRCLRYDGLWAKRGSEPVFYLDVDFFVLDSEAWVDARDLRAAYERGVSVHVLAKALGRVDATVRGRVVEAGGRIEPVSRISAGRQPSRRAN